MKCWLAVTFAVFLVLGGRAECWARGGGGCLEQGTPILTPSGPVPIERLQPGMAVWTSSDGWLRPGIVQALLEVQPDEYLELTAAGRRIRATAEHPFLIAPGVFRRAASLRAGDRLWLWQDDRLVPATLESVSAVRADRPAFNLLVSPVGTYLADGVVVHNKGCFLPDTPILKADGTSAPLRDIRAGDQVLAFTPDGKIVHAAVRGVLTHEVDEYAIVTTERVVLRVTLDHPFYVGDGTFRTLAALRPGDRVIAYDGTGLSPQGIIEVRVIRQRTRVYNLQTDAPHTFFASGIAVHNKGGGGGGFGGGGGWHGGGGGHSGGGTPIQISLTEFLLATLGGGLLGGILRGSLRRRQGLVRQGLIGGGLGALAGPFALFCHWLPGLCIALFLALSVGVKNRRDEDLDYLYSPREIAQKTRKTRKLLEFLARQDAMMEPETLHRLVEATFLKLQECWQDRDYAPMKPLLMPDLFAQHTAQLQGMVRDHEINRIEDAQVERIDLVNVRYTDKPDHREFTALVTAQARDYYVDDRTGSFLRGDRMPARFQEFWTFHRQGNAWLLRDIEQSRESDVLKEENYVEQFTDPQVQAVYQEAAGEEGPAGPWLEKQVATKTGRIDRLLNFLVQTDKIWDQEKMRLRARQVFTAVYLAQEAGNPEAVPSADLFPEVAASLRQKIEAQQARGSHVEYRNLCIRKAELILVRNFANNSADEFTARIRAHAQRIVRRGGTVISADEYVVPFEEYWTFGRQENQWKLKEVLPPARGERAVAQENVDEESSAGQLQWYYGQTRAN
jgi:predicted lipid-binding transport protein (Tim44 family)/uncharacterized membrane protein YgcG